MLIYTKVYLIEANNHGDSKKSAKRKGTSLAEYAFRRFTNLGLATSVGRIDEGEVEMTAAQHKARGVVLVEQALNMSRNRQPFSGVRQKFMEAKERFGPAMGNDVTLLRKCNRHLRCLEMTHELMQYVRETFFFRGEYNLDGKFVQVLLFEEKLSDFLTRFAGDSFLVEEVKEMRCLVEEVFLETPYEVRFIDVCNMIEELEHFV